MISSSTLSSRLSLAYLCCCCCLSLPSPSPSSSSSDIAATTATDAAAAASRALDTSSLPAPRAWPSLEARTWSIDQSIDRSVGQFMDGSVSTWGEKKMGSEPASECVTLLPLRSEELEYNTVQSPHAEQALRNSTLQSNQ